MAVGKYRLSDWAILALAVHPVLLILLDQIYEPQFAVFYPILGAISFLFSYFVFHRLRRRELLYKAALNRSKKSTQWAQNFIYQHLTELRRPLQGLIGVRDVYDFNFENPDTSEYMEIVNHCSEHVVRLMNRLQLYSELRSDEYKHKEVRFTLTHMLEDAFKVAEANNPGKKVSVDQHISPKVLRDYFGPYDLIRTLVVEILDNAIRYSPKSNVQVSADLSKEEDHNLVININDIGPGMTKGAQKELQEKLDRHASSFDFKTSGEGLGIPLIRSLAHRLGAHIVVDSKKGEGTHIEIHLRVPSYSAETSFPLNKGLKKTSNQILIVEDDPLAQKIMAAMLNRLGYRSTIVSNGHDAVEYCRRQKFGFILMDLEMPIMDGWEASKCILQSIQGNDKPTIVALTARNSPADRARAEKAGCSHFIPKPVNRDQIQKLLEQENMQPHFLPNSNFREDKFDGLELLAGKTVDFKKLYAHYNGDMSICQMILTQSILSIPVMLDELDSCVMSRDQEAIHACLHKITGEFRALLCNAGIHLVDRLDKYDSPDNIEFISDLEQLNRYCDSLLKELSTLAKHNEILV